MTQRENSPDDFTDLLYQLLQKLSQLNDLTSLVQTKVPNARIIKNPQQDEDDVSEAESDDSLSISLEQEIHLTRQQKDRIALAVDLLKRDKNHESLREQIKSTKVFDDNLMSIREDKNKKAQKPFIEEDIENLINIEIEKERLDQHNSKSKDAETLKINVRETNVNISDEISLNSNNIISKFRLDLTEAHDEKNPLSKFKDDFFKSRNKLVDKTNEKAKSKRISEYIQEYTDDETFKILL